MLQFWFLCSLFGLLCSCDTNTMRPCSTSAIGGSHRFPPSASPRESMVALQFHLPDLNCQSVHTALSQLGPPDRSSLSSLTLQAIYKTTHQVLWSSPVFFTGLPSPTSHFWTDTPFAVSHSYHYSTDHLPLRAIFEPTRQALWSSPIIPHRIHHSSMTTLE